MRDFPDPMIHRLTHIDSRNEIVLVALDLSGNMLGKSTVCVMGDEKHAEFAVLVADDWQGKGIGAALLKRFGITLYMLTNLKVRPKGTRLLSISGSGAVMIM